MHRLRLTGTRGDLERVEHVAGPLAENRLGGRLGADPRPKGGKRQPCSKREAARRIGGDHASLGGRLEILRQALDPLRVSLGDLDGHGEAVAEGWWEILVRVAVHRGDSLEALGRSHEFARGKSQAGGLGRVETGQEKGEAVAAGVVDLVDHQPSALTPSPDGRSVLPAELIAGGNVVAPELGRGGVGCHGDGEQGSSITISGVGGMALARARGPVEKGATAVLNDGGDQFPDRQRGLLGHGVSFGEGTKEGIRADPGRDPSFTESDPTRLPGGRRKKCPEAIHIPMKTFHEFVWLRMPVADVLREISELWPKRSFQDLFDREVQRLREKTEDAAALEHLDEFQQIDVPGYIDSALRRSGFHDSELDPLVHDICVKLLLGGFFRGWSGQSLVARFKVAVRNAISTLRSRAAKRRKRLGDLPDDVAAAPQGDQLTVSEFRNFLRMRFGDAVVRVLDHRLEDQGDTKDLVGTPGLETAYKVKQAVSQLKDAIRMFAGNDPELSRRIERLVAQERNTFDRRFGRMAGASGRG